MRFVNGFLSIIALAFLANVARATTYTWVGQAPTPNQNDWSNPLNWHDPQKNNGVPGAADTAQIGSLNADGSAGGQGYTVNLSQSTTVASLVIVASTLTLPNGVDLGVTGAASLYAASLTGGGGGLQVSESQITLAGTSTVSFPVGYPTHLNGIDGLLVLNTGTMTIAANTVVNLRPTNSQITNNKTLQLGDGARITEVGTGGKAQLLDNLNEITNLQGATATISCSVTNEYLGSIACNGGTINLSDCPALNQSGLLSAGASGQMAISGGTFYIHNGAQHGGAISITSPTYVDGAAKASGHVTFGSSTLTLNSLDGKTAGTLEVTSGGILDWTGGNIVSSTTPQGKITIDSGATLNLNFTSTQYLVASTVQSLPGGAINFSANGGLLYLQNAAVIDNQGTFTFGADTSIGLSGSGTGTGFFKNSGTIQKTVGIASSQSSIVPTITSTGTITCSAGVLNLANSNGSGELEGTLSSPTGGSVVISSGNYAVNTSLNIDAAGGAVSMSGSTNLTVSDSINITSGAFSILGGTISGVGRIACTSGANLNFDAGFITNKGVLVVSQGAVFTIGGTGVKEIDNCLVINDGQTLVAPGESNLTFGMNSGFVNSRELDLQADSTINATPASGQGAPTITNNGTVLRSVGTSQCTITPAFKNNGQVLVSSGTLYFAGNFTYNQVAGTIIRSLVKVAAAQVTFSPNTVIQGTLLGSGTIAGTNLRNAGTIEVDTVQIYGDLTNDGNYKTGDAPGVTTEHGNFTQSTSGVFTVPIEGPNASTPQFGQLFAVPFGSTGGGGVSLAGLLAPSVSSSYVPAAGTTFTIITAAPGSGLTGTFANAPNGGRVNDMDGSGSFQVSYSATKVLLSNYAPPPTTFSGWQGSYFNAQQAGNPAVSGPLADPDQSGLVNLLKYALNANPGIPGLDARPGVSTDGTSLMLTYNKVESATDVTYTVEQSVDAQNWSASNPTVQVVSDNGFVQVVQASIPMSLAQGGKLFMRLRVTKS